MIMPNETNGSDVYESLRAESRARIIRGTKARSDTAVFWVDEVRFDKGGNANPTLGWYKCQSPYDVNFLAAFKTAIGSKDRKWIPSQKVWAFSPRVSAEIVSLAAAYFDKIVELEDDPYNVASRSPRKDMAQGVAERLSQRSKEVSDVLDEFGKRKVEV
jgi:hypothetical protein